MRALGVHGEPTLSRTFVVASRTSTSETTPPSIAGRGLTDESEILRFLQHGTLVGLLPVPHPILIRKYQANAGTAMWFRTYMWGVIYLRWAPWGWGSDQPGGLGVHRRVCPAGLTGGLGTGSHRRRGAHAKTVNQGVLSGWGRDAEVGHQGGGVWALALPAPPRSFLRGPPKDNPLPPQERGPARLVRHGCEAV